MKTLSIQEIESQLIDCGVFVSNPVASIHEIIEKANTVKPEFMKIFNEAVVNAIYHNLILTEIDFNPAEIIHSSQPDSRSIIISNFTPFIVDYFDSKDKSIHCISMDGEEFEKLPSGNYPVLGTITI